MSQNFKETYYGKKIDTANILNIEDAAKIIKARKTVVITGVTGQDGSHMVDFLLKNTDAIILGATRRLSVPNHRNIAHLKNNPRFKLIELDVTDQLNTEKVIQKEKPDYFINFAANSFVGNSWQMPVNHFMTNALPVLYQLEAINKYCNHCKYYNAGSSEQFGNIDYRPQDINHPFKPRSPYGAPNASSTGVFDDAPDVNRTFTFVIGPTDKVWNPITSTIRVLKFGLVTAIEFANA